MSFRLRIGESKLKQKADRLAAFDPATLDDSVALSTRWEPLAHGGSNYRTHKLVLINPLRYEFKGSKISFIFSVVFFVAGLGAAILTRWAGADSDGHGVPYIVSGIFVIVASFMMVSALKPIVFDKTKNMYWKGFRPPKNIQMGNRDKNAVKLNEIYALQSVAEYRTHKNGEYLSYELNVVLRDGHRLNVVDHGDHDELIGQAMKLATFLNVPLWDATTLTS